LAFYLSGSDGIPVQKVGKDCYQWGNQKVYCGKGAKEKAIKQGIAIENTGWKEAEEKNWLIIPLLIVGLYLSIPYFLDSRGNKVWV